MLQATTTAPDRRRILAAIATEIGQGDVSFPTSPQLARGIRQALYDPDCPVPTAARLIGAEPLLAARIVGLANSVLFRSRGRLITDLPAAIQRVGFAVVRSLASALVIRQLAGTPANPAHRDMAAALWAHSAHAAALAYVLARRITGQNPDTALFAGLVHEAGGFYLISRAEAYPGLLPAALAGDWEDGDELPAAADGGQLPDSVASFQCRIGRAILDALAVPEPVLDAIETLWRGTLVVPPRTLGETLFVADRLAPVRSPLDRLPPDGGLHACAIMDLAFEEGTLGKVVTEAAADVASLTAILRG